MKDNSEVTIEVICSNLPGIRFGDLEPVHLGVQKGKEVVDIAPADRKEVVFRLKFKIGEQPDGSPNFLGPYAQGTLAARFFYLAWGVFQHGQFNMFRRAKIHLNHIEWSHIQAVQTQKKSLKVRLNLTDKKGGPLCATVKPENASWEL